ncbi:unnamed protein product [Cyclocybe aegerita]|uniref:Uncharacterized protein n=1 Tax=Cyclocybe aegerita TaxID=1973307 RepID=A0A8S0W818_CYCAE|nr:unnamed protein product [Cyclocybe aegerita]
MHHPHELKHNLPALQELFIFNEWISVTEEFTNLLAQFPDLQVLKITIPANGAQQFLDFLLAMQAGCPALQNLTWLTRLSIQLWFQPCMISEQDRKMLGIKEDSSSGIVHQLVQLLEGRYHAPCQQDEECHRPGSLESLSLSLACYWTPLYQEVRRIETMLKPFKDMGLELTVDARGLTTSFNLCWPSSEEDD